MYSSSLYAKTVFEIVREESFLQAEPVKPPRPLHLRLPAVAELAVYVFREHHAGAVFLCAYLALFLAKFGTVVYYLTTRRFGNHTGLVQAVHSIALKF